MTSTGEKSHLNAGNPKRLIISGSGRVTTTLVMQTDRDVLAVGRWPAEPASLEQKGLRF